MALVLAGLSFGANAADAPIEVFVSILPQKYFVERIGGQYVNVHVMVGPGQSPATYEPTPKQMTKLAQAAIYFQIGTPFENVWMDRIRATNPRLIIIDAREGVTLRDIEGAVFLQPSANADHDHDHGAKDPHIWTNPLYVKTFMGHFTETLTRLYPSNADYFKRQYNEFATEMETLDNNIQAIIAPMTNKYFLVFHPSWGYFADRYGLIQVSIELQGKSPNAKELAAVVEFSKQNNIKRVFVQKQFSQRSAQAVANAIDGRVVSVDPLAEDYSNNLMEVARLFAGSVS